MLDPWRLRYRLSLRDLAAMDLACAFEFTHEAVCDCNGHFTASLTDRLRRSYDKTAMHALI